MVIVAAYEAATCDLTLGMERRSHTGQIAGSGIKKQLNALHVKCRAYGSAQQRRQTTLLLPHHLQWSFNCASSTDLRPLCTTPTASASTHCPLARTIRCTSTTHIISRASLHHPISHTFTCKQTLRPPTTTQPPHSVTATMTAHSPLHSPSSHPERPKGE